LTEKLKAIQKLDKGASLKAIAAEYGVGVSTVSEWRKNRQKIERWCSVLSAPNKKRKTMKESEHKKIDVGLYLWFSQNRERGVRQKAVDISEDLTVTEARLRRRTILRFVNRV
jgi:transposase-like protein